MAFHCSICGEESTGICVWCTKDTCQNHLCEKCARCSDCCECEVPLREPAREAPPVHAAVHPVPQPLEADPIDQPFAGVPEMPEAMEPVILEPPTTEAEVETVAVEPPIDPMPEPPLPEPMPDPPPERPLELE